MAEIDPFGAQLSSLRDAAGGEFLWNGDATVWSGRAPLLFPIVGALSQGEYRLESKRYRLPRHGFARGSVFSLLESDASQALLRLTSSPTTLEQYPFRFELDVRFALQDRTLTVTAWVRNVGHEPLLASFGFHPAFRWPLPYSQSRDGHVIEFSQDEPAPIRRLDAAGLLTPTRHSTPVRNRRLELTDALFTSDVVIFDELRSRAVVYGGHAGPKLQVSFPDTPYFGLWTKPGAGFICIEPWHGIADPAGFSGELAAKPGIFSVSPGAAAPSIMSITLI